MKAALVVRFSNPVPGREKAALAYQREVEDFAKNKASEGITPPKYYWSSSGENMMIIEGDYEKLLSVTSTPEAMKLENKGMLLLQGYRDELVVAGERDEVVGMYEEVLTELGIK